MQRKLMILISLTQQSQYKQESHQGPSKIHQHLERLWYRRNQQHCHDIFCFQKTYSRYRTTIIMRTTEYRQECKMYITFSFSYPQFYISSGVIHGSVFYSVTNYHHGYHIVYIQYRLTLWFFFLYRYVVCNKCVCRKKNM